GSLEIEMATRIHHLQPDLAARMVEQLLERAQRGIRLELAHSAGDCAEEGGVELGYALLRGVAINQEDAERSTTKHVGIANIADDAGAHLLWVAVELPLDDVEKPDLGVGVLLPQIIGEGRDLDARRANLLVVARDLGIALLLLLAEAERAQRLIAFADQE